MKKKLSLMLALVLMLSLFAGCEKKLEFEAEIEGTPVKIVYADTKYTHATIYEGENEYKVVHEDKDFIITYPNGAVFSYIWNPSVSMWNMKLTGGSTSDYIDGADLVMALNEAK